MGVKTITIRNNVYYRKSEFTLGQSKALLRLLAPIFSNETLTGLDSLIQFITDENVANHTIAILLYPENKRSVRDITEEEILSMDDAPSGLLPELLTDFFLKNQSWKTLIPRSFSLQKILGDLPDKLYEIVLAWILSKSNSEKSMLHTSSQKTRATSKN